MVGEALYLARLLERAHYLRVPWKNRLGRTTQIAIGPPGADFLTDPFLWRVSTAPVVQDGPFSSFAGYDRILTVLRGQGIELDHGPHGSVCLRDRFEPYRFSGDWPTMGRLLAGRITDFNVMTLRERARAEVQVHRLDWSREPPHLDLEADVQLYTLVRGAIHALVGSAQQAFDFVSGDTLLLERAGGGHSSLGRGTLSLVSDRRKALLLGVKIFL